MSTSRSSSGFWEGLGLLIFGVVCLVWIYSDNLNIERARNFGIKTQAEIVDSRSGGYQGLPLFVVKFRTEQGSERLAELSYPQNRHVGDRIWIYYYYDQGNVDRIIAVDSEAKVSVAFSFVAAALFLIGLLAMLLNGLVPFLILLYEFIAGK